MDDAKGCANCGRAMDVPGQKFCPDCGQPTPAHRIDWHFLGHELEHSVLHMDRGIFYTLKNLMLRPGHMIRDYLEGRRAGTVKPMLLVTIMAAAVLFLTKYAASPDPYALESLATSTAKTPDAAAAAAERYKEAMEWLNAHFALVTFLLLPVEALVFKLAFRRFKELNYPEWLVIVAFLTAQAFVIWGLIGLVQRWIPAPMLVMTVLMVGYNVASLMQLFGTYPRWKTALRGLLGFAIYFVVSAFVSGVIAAMYEVIATIKDAGG